MKKILGLGLAALLVMAMVGGGTWAYFNDVETATDNTITAGTLNLQVGTTDGTITAISIGATPPGVKPGDAATAATWQVQNIGNLSGSLSIATSGLVNDENTRSAHELRAGDPNDGTTANGELGGLLKIAVWMDKGTAGWNSGDWYLDPTGPSKVPWATGTELSSGDAYFTVNSFVPKTFSSLESIAGTTSLGNLKIDYNFPHDATTYLSTGLYTDNQAQGDDVKFTLTFTLQ